jgi:NosR/NirI family transcriptional regulator, nitrous oxide reductase regulator
VSRSFGAVAATAWAWIQGGRRAWLALAGFALLGTAFAGVLTKADLDKRFAPALLVGEKNADLPVWPLFAKDPAQPEAKPALKGYVFESVDFEPVRGYAGKPINILVAIDPAGKFLDVRLIGHKEPLFVTPSGTQTLDEFAQQYTGLSVNHSIEIFGAKARTSRSDNSAVLHGVAAGTVTVKAMDRSIMESALGGQWQCVSFRWSVRCLAQPVKRHDRAPFPPQLGDAAR